MSRFLIGNAVVGQSGGPTSAINATLSGVIRGVAETRANGQIQTLFGMRNGIEGLLREDLIDLTAFFDGEEKFRLLEQTPAAALGSCRIKLPEPESDPAFYERILHLFEKQNIRYFFYIGGNDSMDTVSKLTKFLGTVSYPMSVIGIPKTIDNDLMGTDHTPGYGSAAKYIAITMQEIIRDCAVYRIPAVTIVELMGRDAGWLTAAAALGRKATGFEPDMIYLPERVFHMDRFLEDVKAALRRHPNVVIAVSEGIRFADGHYVGEGRQSGATDVFGHAYLAGTAKVLESSVKEAIGCKVRSIELNLPQRCAAHLASATDLAESVTVGRVAVLSAMEGVTGEMMVMDRPDAPGYTVTYGHRPIQNIANRVRRMDDRFINAAGNQVTDACVDYLFPLIQGEPEIRYANGFPMQLIL